MIRHGWVSDLNNEKFVSRTIKRYLLIIIEIQFLEEFFDLFVIRIWITFLHTFLEFIKADVNYVDQKTLAWFYHVSGFLWWDRIQLPSMS